MARSNNGSQRLAREAIAIMALGLPLSCSATDAGDLTPYTVGDAAARADGSSSPDDAGHLDGAAIIDRDAGAGRGDARNDARADASGPPTGTWLSGGSGNGAADGTFGKWRGRPVEIAGTWADVDGDEQREVWSVRQGGEWAGWAGPLDIANGGIFPKAGESWEAAATGAYDDRWRTSLSNIKNARVGAGGPTFIRFAHEFNGDWYWPVTNATADAFKKAWIRFFDLKQSVFPSAKLAWCPNDGTTVDLDVRNAFPGSAYVDVVCVDSYNWDPAANSAAEFDVKIHRVDASGAPVGLEMWRQFAASKGLPMAIGEWSGNAPQGDNPEYMTELHKWLALHGGSGPGQIVYEILFNQWTDFELWPTTKQPKAAARYKDLW